MNAVRVGAMEVWNRLSGRERILIGALALLAALAGGFYLVLMPGWSAAQSAQSRLRAAVQELSETRSLEADLKARLSIVQTTGLPDAITLAETIATDGGLTVTSMTEAGGAIDARLSAKSSAQVIAWAEETSNRTAMRLNTLSITPADGGSLAVSARFSRTAE